MSNEDKMREEFKNWWKDRQRKDELFAPSDVAFFAWKACAAIKDAEIAARDLVIKKFIERAHETKSLLAASMHEPREQSEYEKEINDINDLISNSENHDSRALEKILLEERIKGFEFANGLSDDAYAATLKRFEDRLAELNKE